MSKDLKRNSFKVSIITAFYNAEKYLGEAMESVINQSYSNWELLLINDGSTDRSRMIALSFKDERIRYFEQSNKGVSSARNLGLDNIKGDYFCFLDADDVLTPSSIESRIDHFKNNPHIHFVDGHVHVTGPEISLITKVWHPTFRGCPKLELMLLKESCFVTGTWMIKTEILSETRFCEELTHSEDLFFLIELSSDHLYDYIDSPILYFRRTGESAMSNLDGLARGYITLLKILTTRKLFPSAFARWIYKIKITKVMFLSYVRAGKWKKAFNFAMSSPLS
jgi:teichuronic acid biosynthesis glycosyltransferase TuaG